MNITQNSFLSTLNEASTFSEVILFIVMGLVVVLGVLVVLFVLTSLMGHYFMYLKRRKGKTGAGRKNRTTVTATNS